VFALAWPFGQITGQVLVWALHQARRSFGSTVAGSTVQQLVRFVAAETEAITAPKVTRSEQRIFVVWELDYVCCEEVRTRYKGRQTINEGKGQRYQGLGMNWVVMGHAGQCAAVSVPFNWRCEQLGEMMYEEDLWWSERGQTNNLSLRWSNRRKVVGGEERGGNGRAGLLTLFSQKELSWLRTLPLTTLTLVLRGSSRRKPRTTTSCLHTLCLAASFTQRFRPSLPSSPASLDTAVISACASDACQKRAKFSSPRHPSIALALLQLSR
jgi:hypothetical protein